MREALSGVDLESVIPGLAERRTRGPDIRSGDRAKETSRDVLRIRVQRLQHGLVQGEVAIRQVYASRGQGGFLQSGEISQLGLEQARIGRVADRKAVAGQFRRGHKIHARETAPERIHGPPHAAIPDVGSFHHEIPGDFALQTETPLVLARRAIGIRIQETGRAHHRAHALAVVGGKVREGRLDARRNAVRQLAHILPISGQVGGRGVAVGAEELNYRGGVVDHADASAEHCLGVDLIGDADARADSEGIVVGEVAVTGRLINLRSGVASRRRIGGGRTEVRG